jgi:hypothetical protein
MVGDPGAQLFSHVANWTLPFIIAKICLLGGKPVCSVFNSQYMGDWLRETPSFSFSAGDLSRLAAVKNVMGDACPEGVEVTLTRCGVAIF